MLLLDVVPLSLGIETLGGAVDKLIHRNTTVPARATTRYSTSAEGQTAILINIFQGERELTKDCKLLGTFKLAGIPPMPAGLPQVDVTFLVNENGMLTVSAKEQRSGQQASVTVQAAHGLSPDEVDRLILESVEHAQADFTERQFIEFRNKGEADLKHTERALAEAGDQLAPAERAEIDRSAADLRTALAGTDLDALREAVARLGTATRPLAEVRMNAVVRKALGGKTEADVREGKL
jgi:molecular chaperone DnaK (HSP70)